LDVSFLSFTFVGLFHIISHKEDKNNYFFIYEKRREYIRSIVGFTKNVIAGNAHDFG